jgi:hypothetical protein
LQRRRQLPSLQQALKPLQQQLRIGFIVVRLLWCLLVKIYEAQVSTGALKIEQDTVMLWCDGSMVTVDENRVIKFVQSFYRLTIRGLTHKRFVWSPRVDA